jgi:hypothetical protein
VRGLISTFPSIRGWKAILLTNTSYRATLTASLPESQRFPDIQQENCYLAAPRL